MGVRGVRREGGPAAVECAVFGVEDRPGPGFVGGAGAC